MVTVRAVFKKPVRPDEDSLLPEALLASLGFESLDGSEHQERVFKVRTQEESATSRRAILDEFALSPVGTTLELYLDDKLEQRVTKRREAWE